MNGAVSFTWVVEMITQCMINTEEVIFLAIFTVKKNLNLLKGIKIAFQGEQSSLTSIDFCIINMLDSLGSIKQIF